METEAENKRKQRRSIRAKTGEIITCQAQTPPRNHSARPLLATIFIERRTSTELSVGLPKRFSTGTNLTKS
ncbi:MAG: hypothetical protein HY842_11470 [Bacteroidetes bacterium]|nr:hypothetical protein [Bacteroidota bacterium]